MQNNGFTAVAFIINKHIKCFFNFQSNVTKEADVTLKLCP